MAWSTPFFCFEVILKGLKKVLLKKNEKIVKKFALKN